MFYLYDFIYPAASRKNSLPPGTSSALWSSGSPNQRNSTKSSPDRAFISVTGSANRISTDLKYDWRNALHQDIRRWHDRR